MLATVIANLVGGAIFFWIDKFIFTSKVLNPLWEIKSCVKCADCGHEGYGFRIVLKEGYDKTKDAHPEFRCQACAEKKARAMEALT